VFFVIVCYWCVFGVCVFELVCLCDVFVMFVGYICVTFMFGVCVGLCVFCVMVMCIFWCVCVCVCVWYFLV